MSDTPKVLAPEPEPPRLASPAPAPPEPPPTRRPALVAPLVLLGILAFGLLVGAVAYLFAQEPSPGIDPARIAALESRIGALQQRVDALEKRPAPPPSPAQPATDLRPLEARIAALEQRPISAPSPAPPAPDLGPLQARIDAVQQRVADLAPLPSRIDAVQHRIADLAHLQSAALALANGQPLGAWPDAPPALQKFATQKPPTEPELRRDFLPAARRAADASKPAAATGSLGQRLWSHIAALVTVREGDRVIVGAPASVVLDAARERLDAGDLPGAVTALDALDPAAAAVMADWKTRAQSLLDARAALAKLAQE